MVFESYVGREVDVIWTEPDEKCGKYLRAIVLEHERSDSLDGSVRNTVSLEYEDGTLKTGAWLEDLTIKWVDDSDPSDDDKEEETEDNDAGVDDLSTTDEDSDDEHVPLSPVTNSKKRRRRLPAVKNRSSARQQPSKRGRKTPPAASKKNKRRRQRKASQKEEEEKEGTDSLPRGVDPQWAPSIEEEEEVLRRALQEFESCTDQTAVIDLLLQQVAEGEEREEARAHLVNILQGRVDEASVKKGLERVNEENARIHQQQQQSTGAKLHESIQRHGGHTGSRHAVWGSFPVTTVLAKGVQGADHTLSNDANATNLVMNTMYGSGGGVRVRDRAIVGNQVPTTVAGDYTAVPSDDVFKIFEPSFRRLVSSVQSAGVRIHTCIAPSAAEVVLNELAGQSGTKIIPLRRHAEFQLSLVIPNNRPSFLLDAPYEHRSHMTWQALKHANRLHLAAGCATTAAPVRALLGLPPLQPKTVLDLLGPKVKIGEGKGPGWYTSGAYCEAVMKQRVFAFMAVHGEEKGRRLWSEWYKGCKSRAGTEAATAQGQLLGALMPEKAHDSMAYRLASKSKGDKLPTTAEEAAAAYATAQQKRADGGREGGEAFKPPETAKGIYGTGERPKVRAYVDECGCPVDGKLRYNNGTHLSTTYVRHMPTCPINPGMTKKSDRRVRGPINVLVKDGNGKEAVGPLVGSTGSVADYMSLYPPTK